MATVILLELKQLLMKLCNNAIEHGLKGNNQAIEMKVKIDPSKIEINVTSVSDPEKIPALKALLKPEGGL